MLHILKVTFSKFYQYRMKFILDYFLSGSTTEILVELHCVFHKLDLLIQFLFHIDGEVTLVISFGSK